MKRILKTVGVFLVLISANAHLKLDIQMRHNKSIEENKYILQSVFQESKEMHDNHQTSFSHNEVEVRVEATPNFDQPLEDVYGPNDRVALKYHIYKNVESGKELLNTGEVLVTLGDKKKLDIKDQNIGVIELSLTPYL